MLLYLSQPFKHLLGGVLYDGFWFKTLAFRKTLIEEEKADQHNWEKFISKFTSFLKSISYFADIKPWEQTFHMCQKIDYVIRYNKLVYIFASRLDFYL